MPTTADTPFGLRWRHPLPVYQQAGIKRLVQGSVLLADDMGLGTIRFI